MKYLEMREKFLKLKRELSGPNIEIINIFTDFETTEADDLDLIRNGIKRRHDVILPDNMREMLLPSNINICWNYTIEGRKETGGEFSFDTTSYIFVNSAKTDFADRLTKWEKKMYNQGYRFFDSHPNAGDGKTTALLLENGTVAGNVWYCDILHEKRWEMELNYAEYIEHSILLKGLYYWQFLFIDDPFIVLDFDISSLYRRLEDYPRLFPHIDVTEYLRRYDERK